MLYSKFTPTPNRWADRIIDTYVANGPRPEMDSQRVDSEMSRQSYLTKKTIPMRIFKKARSLLYLHIRRRGREKGQSTIYVLTTEYIEWQERFWRREKGREGKYVINDCMYVCIVLYGKSASFAPKIHLTT